MIGDVEVRDAGSKGRGMYARRAFDDGEFIFRRRHIRILTAAELDRAADWERMRCRSPALHRPTAGSVTAFRHIGDA
jgi:hypothetical protein